MEKARVSVIGSGLMGHGIAQIFALHGHPVVLYDLKQEFLDRALVNVRANLDLMAERGIAPQGAADTALANIRTTLSLEEAARADFIIEAVIEDMPLKQRIFAELDALCAPETVIASNTSVMSITEIASKSVNRGRMVGTHFWNPPYFIPLVEVVQGDDTADKTVEYTMNILRSVGKHPIHCRKDVPGFVANRMQHALWREAVYIVEQGIADAATVDEAVRLSFGHAPAPARPSGKCGHGGHRPHLVHPRLHPQAPVQRHGTLSPARQTEGGRQARLQDRRRLPRSGMRKASAVPGRVSSSI